MPARELCSGTTTFLHLRGFVSSPAVANGVVYIGGGDFDLYAFGLSGGIGSGRCGQGVQLRGAGPNGSSAKRTDKRSNHEIDSNLGHGSETRAEDAEPCSVCLANCYGGAGFTDKRVAKVS